MIGFKLGNDQSQFIQAMIAVSLLNRFNDCVSVTTGIHNDNHNDAGQHATVW